MGLINQYYTGDFICKYTNYKFELYNDSYDCMSYVIKELNPLVVFRIPNNINMETSVCQFSETREKLLLKIMAITKESDFWLDTLKIKER